MNKEELDAILGKSRKYAMGEEGGEIADLIDANLIDANLIDANLARANLTDADLIDANLTRADLADANLAGANLTDANLTDANLARANLTDANLADANLTDANLARANLTDADLADADLTRANLDFSSFPLHCGTFGIVVKDERLIAQICYHLARINYQGQDKDVSELFKSPLFIKVANKFHRVLSNEFKKIEMVEVVEEKVGEEECKR